MAKNKLSLKKQLLLWLLIPQSLLWLVGTILSRMTATSYANTVLFTQDALLATALPLALSLLASNLAVWWGVSRGLKLFYQLRQAIKNRDVHHLIPIEIASLPHEMQVLTNELNALFQAMHAAIDKQRYFIADAAHQLRTPLTGLKSQIELAMRESNIESLRARLQMVYESSTRSIHLINQLLTLARSETGQQGSVPKLTVDLAKLLREITAECVPRALTAEIDLGYDSTLLTANIEANPALLRELFLNLIENAIKYIPVGGTITLRLLSGTHCYIVEVEDNGPGIPDAEKARVFERFYRRTHTGNGCGLGLAIAKEIALQHQGSIALQDTKVQGLIVRVTLPKP